MTKPVLTTNKISFLEPAPDKKATKKPGLTTNKITLLASAPKTKDWDPAGMITTGNIERVKKANAEAQAKTKKK